MLRTFDEARKLGYRAIVIFGHPDYYPRMGFRRAAEFGITTADGSSFDAFMALPLYEGALDEIRDVFSSTRSLKALTKKMYWNLTGTFLRRRNMSGSHKRIDRPPRRRREEGSGRGGHYLP